MKQHTDSYNSSAFLNINVKMNWCSIICNLPIIPSLTGAGTVGAAAEVAVVVGATEGGCFGAAC